MKTKRIKPNSTTPADAAAIMIQRFGFAAAVRAQGRAFACTPPCRRFWRHVEAEIDRLLREPVCGKGAELIDAYSVSNGKRVT